MTPREAASTALRALALAALQMVRSSGRPIDDFHGIPLYDPAKDGLFEALDGFAEARLALESWPEVSTLYGVDQATRVVLSFIYAVLEEPDALSDSEAAIASTFSRFTDELARPEWIFRAIANLEHFVLSSEEGSIVPRELVSEPIVLDNGVTIIGRSEAALRDIGCDSRTIETLFESWGGFEASAYVIYAESSAPKIPDNLVLQSDGRAEANLWRVVLALRLLGPGQVGCGKVSLMRSTVMGSTRSGGRLGWPTASTYRQPFAWNDLDPHEVAEICRRLETAEGSPAAPVAGNLSLALRHFSASFERRMTADSVVDLVTVLEAMLGGSADISYSLSMRVAHLLAGTDPERSELFSSMKQWYGLRSKLVHGSPLKTADTSLLSDAEPLRHVVRRLLRGFLALAEDPSQYGKTFFERHLDPTMLDPSRLAPLRTAMGFTRDPSQDH